VTTETTLKRVSAAWGAATLVLVYQCARSMLRGPEPIVGPALMASATVAVLPGYWFFATASELHAPLTLCATLLFLGLLRAVDQGRPRCVGDGVLQFVGAGLTPATHLSGLAATLPAAYAAIRSDQRRDVARRLGLGFGLFAAVYLGILWGFDLLDSYQSQYGSLHRIVFTEPHRVPGMLGTALSELLLYSAPASTLVPIGLRLLFPLAPRQAWLCVLWLGAWPLIAFPIEDHAYGSYYLPTFPVQGVLAVLALLHMSRSLVSALVATLLAVLPGIATLAGDGWGLVAWSICAACLFLGSRGPSPSVRPSLVLGLPLAALALSGFAYVPRFFEDPVRERIRAVQGLGAASARIILLESDVGVCRQWARYLEGPQRLLNPLLAELRVDGVGEEEIRSYQAQVAGDLAAGREVWLVGSLRGWEQGRFVPQFLKHLQDNYRLQAPTPAPEDVHRVLPR